MHDTTSAVACLTSVFLDLLKTDFPSLARFEDEAIRIGHDAIAKAMGRALEILDEELCSDLPEGMRIHEVRGRALATEVGDVSFSRHVCHDEYGCTYVPLDEAVDLPRGMRISPGAFAFLVDAGAEVSYQKAADLLARAGGSTVSARSVMRAMRKAGDACEEADVKLAHELYANGVLPDADSEEPEICLESDGTYVPLQEGGKVEVKALVAYAGKRQHGNRAERISPVRFGCVSSPRGFWTQGIAAVGTRFDLSKIEVCHTGFDGEAQYKAAGGYLKSGARIDGNLDPFHVNRYVAACFGDKGAGYRQVMDCLWSNRANDAADLLEECHSAGEANANAGHVAAYIRNNAEYIHAGSVSLGTMEAEQEHLYKSRMASVPCAWSREGVNDMARIRSRKYSKREIVMPTRDSMLSAKRRRARERRIERALEGTCRRPPETVGRGWEYPYRASTNGMRADIRYHAGLYNDHWVRESNPQ